MARQPDIRYMPIYTDGSSARKLEPVRKPKKPAAQPRQRVRRAKKRVVYVDPLSLCALAAAAVLLIAMAVGLIRLGAVNAATAELENDVSALQTENQRLSEQYQAGYDLAEIEQQALAMGFVPVEQVEHVTIQVQIPEAEAQPTFWENVGAFWAELFAKH